MKKDALQSAEKYTKAHRRKKRWYRVVTCLACVVVFCTVYALILPAITQETESSKLTDDSAYVESIAISQYDTGTAPFDSDDQPGNDSSSTNMIVRTFDTVTYNIRVKYLTYENGKTFNDARVRLEFVLPVDVNQAEFNQTAMGWMEDPELTTEKRTINGTETQCQVLTCYKHLLPSEGNTSVVPGEFGENVTVNVKMMKNGDIIAPIFSAAMEYNTWEGTCATHHAEEKKTITAENITISAAPKYNVQIKPAFATDASMDYDFRSTSTQLIDRQKALNQKAGVRPGRIFVMGVTLQLYNDNESKQMRGIELPQGPITFDIKLSSKFHPVYGTAQSTTQAGTVTDVTNEYTPLVWSYGPQNDGNNPDRYTGMTTYAYAFGNSAPWNRSDDRDNGCYNGGTWTAVQNGSKIQFTVTDYQFDGVFPCTDAPNTAASTTYYNKKTGIRNIGCFSAMELYIVQPFTNTSGTKALDDFSTGGSQSQNVGTGICIDGSFIMTVEDVNLMATSVSGQALVPAPEGNANQGGANDAAKGDDKQQFTVDLKRPGGYEQRHLYSNKESMGMADIFGNFEDAPESCAKNGDDWAVIGTDFRLNFGGYAKTNGDDANKMCAAKWLLKFDPEAIELVSGNAATIDSQNYYKYKFLYAVKPDGTRWENDKELKDTNMFQLCYYAGIAEAKDHGEIVGILVEAAPKSTIEALPLSILLTYFSQNAKVKEEVSLADRRFIITEESMIWTADQFTAAGENIPSLLGNNPSSPTSLPQHTFYLNSPSLYPNGDGVYDQHVGGYTQGDTLLVLSNTASILKKVAQKMPGGIMDKTSYNLDADQRVIDFVLEPSVNYGGLHSTLSQTTTVTIVDKLPQYLYYRSGSSYFGGTYTQTSENGGTQGTVTDGVLNEPTVVTSSDGTQTLTWTIPDVVVGQEMPLIHYSVNVGTKGDKLKDVPQGTTNLTNTVEISATGDERIHSIAYGNVAEVGVVLTLGQASSYGKYSKNTVVEPDGEINYVIYYDNNSGSPISNIVMLDTMPRNGYFGNSFTGDYTVKGWKMDTEKCEPSRFTLYYTQDERYAGKTIQDITKEDITTNWTSATINIDGRVTNMNGQMPVAWALIGELDANKGVYVDLTIKLNPGTSNGTNNVYHNTFSHGSNGSIGNTVTTTEEHSVIRTLEGLTWMDENADGVQNTGEQHLSGVNVSLLKLREGTTFTSEASGNPDVQLSFDFRMFSGLDASQLKTIRIVASGILAGQHPELFYATDHANLGEKPPITLVSNTTAEREYVYKLEGCSGWEGTIQTLRWDPFQGLNQSVTLKSITFDLADGSTRVFDFTQEGAYSTYLGRANFSPDVKVGSDPNNEADYVPFAYPNGTEVVIKTGETVNVQTAVVQASDTGRYKFTDLPAGTFAVRFEDGESTKISPLIASPVNMGGDDTCDSDGIATYSDNKLKLLKTVILNIEMPPVEKMNVALYESKYHDSGFYEWGDELPATGGCGTTVLYIFSGIIMLISGTLIYNRLLKRQKEGGRQRS